MMLIHIDNLRPVLISLLVFQPGKGSQKSIAGGRIIVGESTP